MTQAVGDDRRPEGRPGRRNRRARRTVSAVPVQPLPSQARHRIGPVDAIDDDRLEAIHRASLDVLARTGIEFLHPEARRLLADAGAEVDELRVRFDPELVTESVALAPSRFTWHGRVPERNVEIGGDFVANSCVGSTPMYVTLDGERRSGDTEGYRNFLRLTQMLTSIHVLGGYPVEPIDLDPAVRHLHCAYDAHTLTDLPYNVYSLGRQRNVDGIEMVRIARGVDDTTLEAEPSLWTVINANSPLRFDGPMLAGILEMSARNQIVCVTPFTLAGAMAPITLAGALVQQNAEALAGIVLTQVVRAGSPVIYGGFTSNVDMRSGSPAFGTPEYAKAALIGGQLARRYGLPYRSSNVSAANAVDAQAGYESMWALWGAVMGGANLIMHGAGWMEGGLHASYDKMVIDADLLHMVANFLDPLDTSDAELADAVAAIDEVGPGGHFFATEHTKARYTTEFHQPLISDWRNWESWTEAGQPEAKARANRLARDLLEASTPPPIDDAIEAELRDYVDRRVAEGGVPGA